MFDEKVRENRRHTRAQNTNGVTDDQSQIWAIAPDNPETRKKRGLTSRDDFRRRLWHENESNQERDGDQHQHKICDPAQDHVNVPCPLLHDSNKLVGEVVC